MNPVLQNPYCSIADVQRESQNTNADDVQKFIDSINLASRYIDGYCRRDFMFHNHATVALVVEENWVAGGKIYLPWPVITLTKVETTDVLGVATVMDAGDYRVAPQFNGIGGVIEMNTKIFPSDRFISDGLLPNRSFAMRAQIRLTGTFGYRLAVADDVQLQTNQTFVASQWPSPSVPAEIRIACAVIASVRSGKAKKEIIDYAGQKQTATVKVVPKDVMDALNRFRRPLL